MGFFSRNREALDPPRSDDVAFDTVRRSPRGGRTRATADSRFDAAAPLDPADATRRRARHRLIGAIALALAAIVFVPMLFNTAPVAVPDDIALQIPDRGTPFEGRRGVPDASRGPLKPSGDLPPATSVSAADAPVAPTSTPAPAAEAAAPPASAAKPAVETPATRSDVVEPAAKPVEKAEKRPEKVVEKVAEKVAEKPTEKPTEKPKPTDDPRAMAALEGRPDAATAAAPKPAAVEAASGRAFAVQIAAYASADRARSERDLLVAGGLKAYTEPVATSQGQRTRVRLGPFASREAADRARAKLKTMKLDGSVVPL